MGRTPRLGFLGGPDPLRWFLYGYNTDEVPLPTVNWFDPPQPEGLHTVASGNTSLRSPEMVSLPCQVIGGVYFRPNTRDSVSAAQGLRKRLVHDRKSPLHHVLVRFAKYVQDKLKREFEPLQVDEIPTFEEWVAQVNHPDWRKEEYRRAYDQWANGEVSRSKLSLKKCFVKPEFYDDPKFHRIIHGPTDYEKVLHGPVASAMEKKIFKRPEFIKKIPRAGWPAYICERVGMPGFRVFASDFTSFEANFLPKIQRVCELAMTEYMLAPILHQEGVQDLLHSDRMRILTSKLFLAWIKGRRSSGQITTSLFNGLSNEFFAEFILQEYCGATEVKCVIEGDDGLFAHNGTRDPEPWMYAELGLTIKIEIVENWYEASFCGVVTHPDVLAPLANPWKVVFTATWANSAYLRASDRTLSMLAQVKGLSYLAQYPGCPVIQSVACWMLRVSGFERERLDELLEWYRNQRGVTWWDQQVIVNIKRSTLFVEPVRIESRAVMAKVFNVPINIQLQIEELFDYAETNQVVLDPSVIPEKYSEMWGKYVRLRPKNDPELNLPFHLPDALYPQNLSPMVRGRYASADLYYKVQVPY